MRSRRLVRAATAVTVLAAALVLAAASPATAASNPSGVRVDDAASGRAWLSWSAPSTTKKPAHGCRLRKQKLPRESASAMRSLSTRRAKICVRLRTLFSLQSVR